RLLGVQDAPREQQIASALLADEPDQEDGNERGNESDPYLAVAETGSLGGQREITKGGDPAAARDGRAVHRGNQRFGEIVNPPEEVRHAARVGEVRIGRTRESALQHPAFKNLVFLRLRGQ